MASSLRERVEQQEQQARHNKNKARTNLGGSLGSPSSFDTFQTFPSTSPLSVLEFAAIVRPYPFLAVHSAKQCIPC